MQENTIIFKECELGHGRLVGTNWIDHGCQYCEIERLRKDAQPRMYKQCAKHEGWIWRGTASTPPPPIHVCPNCEAIANAALAETEKP